MALERIKRLTSNLDPVSGKSQDTSIQELDAIIVGAGFAGVYQLKRLRDQGYNVLLVEAGCDYGGVWYWNRYPGARVDTAGPQYQFSDPDLRKDWRWNQRFPGSAEIRAYFDHVASRWDLRRDTRFNTFVNGASWDAEEAKWSVTTEGGPNFRVKYLLINAGFAARRYIPNWKGIDTFQGTFMHPSYWPHEEPDLKDKRIAIIGTGATAVQIAQDLSKIASQLTVFQRTPNTALPMRQVNYNSQNRGPTEDETKDSMNGRTNSFGGFDFNFLSRNTFDDTPDKRREVYERLWQEGDFKFWLATYQDMLFAKDANLEAYNFWRDKTRAKIEDPKIADLLAPIKQEYAFGCKRIPLENGFFEIFNQQHVRLIDVRATPIEEITKKGVKTSVEEMEFDYIICATGYDAFTGSFTQLNIRGTNGHPLNDYWKDGVKTYLGMCVRGFPNMFFTYGPQAPTALCNGPTCAELQGTWIVDMINHMRDHSFRTIEATKIAEDKWKEVVLAFANASLLPSTKSWYMGDNIPGKPREPLIYLGGVPAFYKTLCDVTQAGYDGFELSK